MQYKPEEESFLLNVKSIKARPMTQITLTLDLDNDVNPTKIKNIIGNIKGILKVSSAKNVRTSNFNKKDSWVEKMEILSKMVDMTDVDTNDERTQYILSK